MYANVHASLKPSLYISLWYTALLPIEKVEVYLYYYDEYQCHVTHMIYLRRKRLFWVSSFYLTKQDKQNTTEYKRPAQSSVWQSSNQTQFVSASVFFVFQVEAVSLCPAIVVTVVTARSPQLHVWWTMPDANINHLACFHVLVSAWCLVEYCSRIFPCFGASRVPKHGCFDGSSVSCPRPLFQATQARMVNRVRIQSQVLIVKAPLDCCHHSIFFHTVFKE